MAFLNIERGIDTIVNATIGTLLTGQAGDFIATVLGSNIGTKSLYGFTTAMRIREEQLLRNNGDLTSTDTKSADKNYQEVLKNGVAGGFRQGEKVFINDIPGHVPAHHDLVKYTQDRLTTDTRLLSSAVTTTTVRKYTADEDGIREPSEYATFNLFEKRDPYNAKLKDGETDINPIVRGIEGFIETDTTSDGKSIVHQYYNETDKGVKDGGEDSFNQTGTGYNVSRTFSNDILNEPIMSPLLKKTNELFRKGTIRSMINSFHDVTGGYSETQTAIDKKKGVSRGRNLLKKNRAGKENGYDDPYCRVWTSHKQYSKLSDRIRPFFIDENQVLDPKTLVSEKMVPGYTRFKDNTVLQDNGFVKITPYEGDSFVREGNKPSDITRCMFSIENLAWRDINLNRKIQGAMGGNVLSPEQIGPNGGRIMWFPPYGLTFNESSNVQWDNNTFIGRGEKIYTYIDTERSGTLSFILLIDHPSYVNQFKANPTSASKTESEQDLLRFFAGCGTEGKLEDGNKRTKANDGESIPENDGQGNDGSQNKLPNNPSTEVVREQELEAQTYTVFFDNNNSAYDYNKKKQPELIVTAITHLATEYEVNGPIGSAATCDERFKTQILDERNYVDSKSFNLNQVNFGNRPDTPKKIANILGINIDRVNSIHSFNDLLNDAQKIKDILTNQKQGTKLKKIEYQGFASHHGYVEGNERLINSRFNFIKTVVEKYLGIPVDEKDTEVITTENQGLIDEHIISVKAADEKSGFEDVSTEEAKIARAAYVTFYFENTINKPQNDGGTTSTVDTKQRNREKQPGTNTVTSHTIVDMSKNDWYYDNEYLYFKNLEMKYPLVYKNLVDKIQYFSPAFHSITPEGFNARLTFLHQCTRQGPTTSIADMSEKDIKDNAFYGAANLSFGRAPYCILRIGDFYYTKILIEHIQINYENNGISWDLNPEGAGVQPMYAKIDISFKFIGGSDIQGPIEKLQNAVSFNYYANTSLYDRRAEYMDYNKGDYMNFDVAGGRMISNKQWKAEYEKMSQTNSPKNDENEQYGPTRRDMVRNNN